jgi:hypothetical protein
MIDRTACVLTARLIDRRVYAPKDGNGIVEAQQWVEMVLLNRGVLFCFPKQCLEHTCQREAQRYNVRQWMWKQRCCSVTLQKA